MTLIRHTYVTHFIRNTRSIKLTPVECEALVLLLVIPELFHVPAAGPNVLGQLARVLAGSARGLTALARQEPISVALLPAVVELHADALGGVVVPTGLSFIAAA